MLTNIKKARKDQKGFTIIEVLIVLAIAGLILLIVFLAVPALQRSSRNTQRKNDASAIAGAIANFISNNGGSLPGGVALDSANATTVVDFCTAGDGGSANAKAAGNCTSNTNLETAKLGYYAPTGVYLNSTGVANVTLAAVGSESDTAVSTNTVVVDEGYTCNSSGTNVGTANSRSAAILFATETGSGNGSEQCVEQ